MKIPANQAAVKVRRHKLCQLFKNIGKTTVAVSIVVSAVALVLIDILIGFYAGYDPWDPLALKIVIGGLAGLLTGLACGGFSLYSLQGIFDRLRQEDNSNIVSQTHPVAYLALSIVLVIGGLLSGGSGAIAGRDELRRLLQDLGQNELAQWFPSVAETLGYGGAISVAIPYCMDWVQWSLHTYAEKKGILRCNNAYIY
ncbi:MAG: hypothetical protein HWD59_10750 [Coxiellaceae bacterium]|nr:MAG: hypothetical protein HWD59_10750 [Coxiellaceae bacterium]